ncbi:MAG: DUF5723 family protein [Tunicatimonas sp.]
MNYRYWLMSAFTALSVTAMAQQELTLHLMNNIQQASYTNPAFRPRNNIHITLTPILPSVQVGVNNSGFTYNQIVSQVETDEDGQRILDLEKLYRNTKVGKRSYANASASLDLLAVSFRTGEARFSFNVTERFQARMGYSDALLRTAVEGNVPGETIRLGGYWLRGMHYREIGLGYNRKLLEDGKLVVGGRLKTLFGLSNITTRSTEYNITTGSEADLYALSLEADMRVQTSGFTALDDDITPYLANTKNFGMGVDLGATYQLNDEVSFSGSVVNLGFINWKSHVRSYRSEGSYSYTGVDNNDLFTGGGFEIDMTELTDSIADTFEVTEDSASYVTGLPTQMYLTGYYRLAPNTKASATLYTDYIGSFRRGLSLGISQQVGRWLQAAATYSMHSRSFSNLGVGFTATTGPKGLQLYCVTDNIVAVLNPGGARVANLRAGLSLVF